MDIADAIRNRRLLSFGYDGYQRVVEPHCYGIDGKGHNAIRGYQVGGHSHSGENVGWKLFHVQEMRQLSVSGETFSAPRAGYKRGDKAFQRIIEQL